MSWWIYAQRHSELDNAIQFLGAIGDEISGKFVEKGPGQNDRLAELIVEAEASDARCMVVVPTPSALSERSLTRNVILHYCLKQNIRVFSLERMRDLQEGGIKAAVEQLARSDRQAWQATMRWWLMENELGQTDDAPVWGIVGEVITEWKRIQKWLQAARVRQRRRTEKLPGRTPFGEKEEEREVVERILVLHREGRNLTAIAISLEEEGHRTRTGKAFRPQTVKNYILRYGTGDAK